MPGQSFGVRLKELREGARLTQSELAGRAGMHQFGVAKLEQGVRQPTWATVETLARALGLTCAAFEGTSRVPVEAPAEPPPAKAARPKPQAPKTKKKGKPGAGRGGKRKGG